MRRSGSHREENDDRKIPQKVSFQGQDSDSSKGSSPVFQGPEPPVPGQIGGTIVEESSSDRRTDSSPAASPNTVSPVYLSWGAPQQGSTRWADQRLSPALSPLVPTMHPPGSSATPGIGMGMNRQDDDDSKKSDNGEKSVMVCRHWKSKGWCRLDAQCKFLHPEHKRGTGVPIPPTKPANSTGAQGSTGTPPGTGSKRSSRRAGRNKHGSSAEGARSGATGSSSGGLESVGSS